MTEKNGDPQLLAFGKRLLESREAAELTQQELGDAVRLSRARISQMEKGGGLPDRKKWQRLAHLLSVNPDWLIFGRGEPGGEGMSHDETTAIAEFRHLPPHKRKVAAAMIHALVEGEPDPEGEARPTKRERT